MDHQQHYMLNYLDRPVRLLFLTVDEFLVLLAPLLAGFWFLYALAGFITSIVAFLGLRLFKRRFGKGNLRQGLYWHLPTSRQHMKLFIPSWNREYIG